MSVTDLKLSVPVVRKRLPRPLTPSELSTLTLLADVLCGPSNKAEPPSRQGEFERYLELAVATRCDSFDLLMDLIAVAGNADDVESWLRTLHDAEQETFQVLSSVLGGAYLMVPAVMQAVGYPGQHRDPATGDEAVDEILESGLLEPVIERGQFFIPTPAEA